MYICFYKTIMICNLYCEACRVKTHVCLSTILLHITLFYSLNNALKYPRFMFSTLVIAAPCLSHESHSSSALSVSENFDSRLGGAATWGKVNHAHLVKLVITLRFHITECPLVHSQQCHTTGDFRIQYAISYPLPWVLFQQNFQHCKIVEHKNKQKKKTVSHITYSIPRWKIHSKRKENLFYPW